jgi:Glycosyltransferase WbsX
MESKKHRLFSLYLPQFHPLPENDKFWGKGFTEWHNVASAKPKFRGHHQPHLPTELGYYDLRLKEVMKQQSDLASEYGIDGFIFYHYWFNGRSVMEKPLYNYLELGNDKLPYYLCWANENWSRRWDGSEQDVLLHQDYKVEDDEKHFEFFLPFFNDEKYVRVNGCPVIALYRPKEIPYLREWTAHMQTLAKSHGLPGVYLIYVINLGVDGDMDIKKYGFDAGLVFQPSWKGMPEGGERVGMQDKVGKLMHILKLRKNLPLNYNYEIINYSAYVQADIRRKKNYSFPCFYSVFPSWDNSARRKKGGGKIFRNASPSEFKIWLEYYYKLEPFSKDENFLVINAWNEWAEGNHLEPCTKWGRSYLEKVSEVVKESPHD